MSYYIWLILGIIAFVIEMILPTFFALFAGVGFISAAAVAFFFPEFLFWQLIIAAVFMLIGAVIFSKRRIGDDEQDTVGTHNEFVGIVGKSTSVIAEHKEGMVELYTPIVGSRHWPAVSQTGQIDENVEVRVVELRGNTVIVTKI
jgi:inner membrane protein